MPIPAATQHANGDEMNWFAIGANLDAYRGWVNEIPSADVEDEAVQQEHIVRPVIQGWPSNVIVGQREIVAWSSFGLNASSAVQAEGWSTKERATIIPYALGRGGLHRLPLGSTVYLPEAGSVEVVMSFDFHVRVFGSSGASAAESVRYPTEAGAGTEAEAGQFAVVITTRSTGEEEVQDDQVVAVYPLYPFTWFNDAGMLYWRGALSAGTYDFFLGYQIGARVDKLYQIDVTRFSGKVLVHM